jgi:cytoskeletal protein CcmA (bactofilin family)
MTGDERGIAMFKGKHGLNPNMTDTLIGEGTIVEGSITSAASLRIEGHVTGDIHCTGDVTIGEKGLAASEITARNIINAGTIRGAVKTSGKLTITSTGKVHGNIHVAKLVIADGGAFEGTSKMELKPAQANDKSADPIPLKNSKGSKEKASAAG